MSDNSPHVAYRNSNGERKPRYQRPTQPKKAKGHEKILDDILATEEKRMMVIFPQNIAERHYTRLISYDKFSITMSMVVNPDTGEEVQFTVFKHAIFAFAPV